MFPPLRFGKIFAKSATEFGDTDRQIFIFELPVF